MSDKAGGRLRGRRIAIAENRELDELAALIEAEGGEALRYPLVAIVPTDDVESVRQWLGHLIEGRMDDVILMTGEGLRRLAEFAEQFGVREQFIEALRRVRKITRGPKPARVLTELGLRPDLPARAPTTDGVIATLASEDLRGRRVGLQLYGTDPNERLVSFLQSRGATVLPVAPYKYAPASDDSRVRELLEQIDRRKVDAIVFTSAPQVRRIVEVAEATGLKERLPEVLEKTVVAAIGPVTANELRSRGLPVHLTLDRHFFMKPLIDALAERLGRAR